MCPDAEQPPQGIGTAAPGLSSDDRTDTPENNPTNNNLQAVAAAKRDLLRDYACEAGLIASTFAQHFAEQLQLGSPLAAESSMRAAIGHFREASRAFREWQGKPLPAPAKGRSHSDLGSYGRKRSRR